MKKTILLSAPHSYCESPVNEFHECDLTVKTILNTLLKALRLVTVNTKSFNPDKPRDGTGKRLDLNRKWARGDIFRRDLTEAMLRMDKKNGLLLDIHSYRESNEKFGQYELCLLDIQNEDYSYPKLVTEMEKYLKGKGVKVSIFAAREIDIIEESRSYNIESALLEFNENLSSFRIRQISTFLAFFLQDYN